MALEQKYIEVRSSYDFDDWFVSELATCPHQAVNEIVEQLEKQVKRAFLFYT